MIICAATAHVNLQGDLNFRFDRDSISDFYIYSLYYNMQFFKISMVQKLLHGRRNGFKLQTVSWKLRLAIR